MDISIAKHGFIIDYFLGMEEFAVGISKLSSGSKELLDDLPLMAKKI